MSRPGRSVPRKLVRRGYRAFEAVLPRLPGPAARWLTAVAARFLERLRPRLLQIEPVSRCNLRCPICPIGSGVMTRSGELLPLDRFIQIIDYVASERLRAKIFLTGYGEPVLHPDLGAMVRCASQHGLEVFIETNGTLDRVASLVGVANSHLWVAVDGVEQSTYERYRHWGRLSDVLKTLRLLAALKQERNTRWPTVRLQFIVMKHNEHEIGRLVPLAAELEVDELALKHVQIGGYHDRPRDDLARDFLPVDSRFVLNNLPNEGRPSVCPQGLAATVLANGDLVMCCIDYDGKYRLGNLFGDEQLLGLWFSPQGRAIRRAALMRKAALCRHCGFTNVEPVVFRHLARPRVGANEPGSGM
ncbi:MAG: radical SAM protein [Planctomycetota bacterium]